MTLAWTAPTGTPVPTDYRVDYRVSGTLSWTTFDHTASTVTGIAVTGLTNGTAYEFRVAAVSGAVVGGYTVPTVTVTPADPSVTGQPTNLSGTPGDGQVRLTWVAPTTGPAVTDYVVQSRTVSPLGAWTTYGDGVSTATSATVTGLTNATTYEFQVAAVSGGVTGFFTVPTVSLTPVASLLIVAPTNFAVTGTAKVSKKAALTIGWGLPALPAGTVSFTVDVATNSGFTTGLQSMSFNETAVRTGGIGSYSTALVSGTTALTNGTKLALTTGKLYYLRIRTVVTPGGSSAWSPVPPSVMTGTPR